MRVGWTTKHRIHRDFALQNIRIFNSKLPNSRTEAAERLAGTATESIIVQAILKSNPKNGYEGLALYRILTSLGRYQEAAAIRRQSLEILSNFELKALPIDHTRVSQICRSWLGIVRGTEDLGSFRSSLGEHDRLKLPWVIIGPKCRPHDLSSLSLDEFAAVSLNRSPPSWLEASFQNAVKSIIFLNGTQGEKFVYGHCDSLIPYFEGRPRLIYFKDHQHAKISRRHELYRKDLLQTAPAAQISHLYVNGSPNMLPIALMTAIKSGISKVFILGFDLYSNEIRKRSESRLDEDFERRINFLVHDQLEQRNVLRSLLHISGYSSDKHLQSALLLSDFELLRRVGGMFIAPPDCPD